MAGGPPGAYQHLDPAPVAPEHLAVGRLAEQDHIGSGQDLGQDVLQGQPVALLLLHGSDHVEGDLVGQHPQLPGQRRAEHHGRHAALVIAGAPAVDDPSASTGSNGSWGHSSRDPTPTVSTWASMTITTGPWPIRPITDPRGSRTTSSYPRSSICADRRWTTSRSSVDSDGVWTRSREQLGDRVAVGVGGGEERREAHGITVGQLQQFVNASTRFQPVNYPG